MAKKVAGQLKLQVPAGKANPSPPVGPALGQRGINIMEFCKAFNARTQEMEVGHLLLGDLAHLRLRDRAGAVAPGGLRAALELGRFLQEVGHRRRLHLEGERPIRIDRDHHRDWRVLFFFLGLRVIILAEFHDVEAALAERGTDRGDGVAEPAGT